MNLQMFLVQNYKTHIIYIKIKNLHYVNAHFQLKSTVNPLFRYRCDSSVVLCLFKYREIDK